MPGGRMQRAWWRPSIAVAPSKTLSAASCAGAAHVAEEDGDAVRITPLTPPPPPLLVAEEEGLGNGTRRSASSGRRIACLPSAVTVWARRCTPYGSCKTPNATWQRVGRPEAVAVEAIAGRCSVVDVAVPELDDDGSDSGMSR